MLTTVANIPMISAWLTGTYRPQPFGSYARLFTLARKENFDRMNTFRLYNSCSGVYIQFIVGKLSNQQKLNNIHTLQREFNYFSYFY